MEKGVRLAKKIAESGVASRREAERLIEAGYVSVDGEIVKTPVFFITDKSEIHVNGKKIFQKSEEIVVWKFHKPRGVITTKNDPQNRKTVFDFFPETNERLLYIGRLDYNSEGLLLFTNNGDLARKMELPSSKLKRVYRVRILGNLTENAIKKMKDGLTVDGIKYGSIKIESDGRVKNTSSSNNWITVTLSEGKNREIRKVMSYFGCTVNRLIRISYGAFILGNLKIGEISKENPKKIKEFIKSLLAKK